MPLLVSNAEGDGNILKYDIFLIFFFFLETMILIIVVRNKFWIYIPITYS